jgi:hypothetical protein
MKNKITHKERIERDTERGWEVQHETVKQERERLLFSAYVVLGSILLAGAALTLAILIQ